MKQILKLIEQIQEFRITLTGGVAIYGLLSMIYPILILLIEIVKLLFDH